jgi:hypothetical protein
LVAERGTAPSCVYLQADTDRVEDLLQHLVARLDTCDRPVKLTPGQCAQLLGQVSAVIAVDDLSAGPEKVGYLLDVLRGCRVVIGSARPVPGRRGTSLDGSLAFCQDRLDDARHLLQHALALREQAGDRDGADLTRHNLQLLEPPAPPPPPRPRAGRRRILLTLASLASALALVTGTKTGFCARQLHDRGGKVVRRPHQTPVITRAASPPRASCRLTRRRRPDGFGIPSGNTLWIRQSIRLGSQVLDGRRVPAVSGRLVTTGGTRN